MDAVEPPHCIAPAVVGGIVGAAAGAGIAGAATEMQGAGGVAAVLVSEAVGATFMPIVTCAMADTKDPRTVPAASYVIGGIFVGGAVGTGALAGLLYTVPSGAFGEENWALTGALVFGFVGGGAALGGHLGWRLSRLREPTITVTPTANGALLRATF